MSIAFCAADRFPTATTLPMQAENTICYLAKYRRIPALNPQIEAIFVFVSSPNK